jgi:hypothetical protein
MRRRVVCPRSHPASLYARRPPASFPSGSQCSKLQRRSMLGGFYPLASGSQYLPEGTPPPPLRACTPPFTKTRRWHSPAAARARGCSRSYGLLAYSGRRLRSRLLATAQPLACSRQPLAFGIARDSAAAGLLPAAAAFEIACECAAADVPEFAGAGSKLRARLQTPIRARAVHGGRSAVAIRAVAESADLARRGFPAGS